MAHRARSHDLHMACLFDAIRCRHERAVTTLLRLYELDINDNTSHDEFYATAMHVAAETDDEDMIRLVASLGGKVDNVDYYGHTPLYESMLHERRTSVRVLLELGADLYVQIAYLNRDTDTTYYNTPLSVNKEVNQGRPYDFVVPYTKVYKRLRKLRTYARVVGTLVAHYRRSVENVWKPDGVGFHSAREEFIRLLIEVA